jgi:hypothetical protein
MPGQGIKFFDRSYSDITRLDIGEITVTIDSGDPLKELMFNRRRLDKWESSGAASDLTDVVLEIDFLTNRTISDLILIDTNLKDFKLDYWTGAVFSNVFTETANASSFYHKIFTPQVTTKIKFTMSKTIVANEEKEIVEFIISNLIGQLEFRPLLQARNQANVQENKMINGKSKFVFNETQHIFNLQIRNYTNINDRILLQTLTDLADSFLIWPSGGDITQFSHPDEGYRLEDIFLVSRFNFPSPQYTGNYYKAGTNFDLLLKEVS